MKNKGKGVSLRGKHEEYGLWLIENKYKPLQKIILKGGWMWKGGIRMKKNPGWKRSECMWSYNKPAGETLCGKPSKEDPKAQHKMAPFIFICIDPKGCRAYPGDWETPPNAVERAQDPTQHAIICFHASLSGRA